MYKKILLPLDGSDISRRALRHASGLARATDGEVVLIQIIDSEAQVLAQTTTATIEPLPAGPISIEIVHQAVEGQRLAAQETLDAAAQQLREDGIPTVTTEVIEGSAGDEITAAAARLGCDLVVMATHGRSGIRRAILGSVADHVVRHTPGIAVLLVHPES
ncbi:MAG: universal stress protein [Chloroflexi bacterium]|nr:universal stress protein [Chloroflexota bacterium]MDA1003129.1 universal stress protein [Chloroflexota bacterium]